MTIIVDTSLWIVAIRDRSGAAALRLRTAIGNEPVVMAPPIRLELPQGCRREPEWRAMLARVDAFETVTMASSAWDEAAKIYCRLRQDGLTVRSALDCCIAQLCIDHDSTLLHCDRDFATIATVAPLKHRHILLDKA